MRDDRGNQVRARGHALWAVQQPLGVIGGTLIVCVLVLIATGCLGMIFSGSAGARGVVAAVLMLNLMLFVGGMLTALIWMGRRAGVSDELAGFRLPRGECAACAHPIREIPAEADGCTVCPECGAAWRLGDRGAGSTGAGGSTRL